MIIEFDLPGCRSLKEKRSRLGGLRERFGKKTNLAVTECGGQDNHGYARYAFVAAASDAVAVERILSGVEDKVEEVVDAYVSDSYREELV